MTSEFYERRVVLEIKCNYCGYRWVPRVQRPKECPKCTHRDYDKVKVRS